MRRRRTFDSDEGRGGGLERGGGRYRIYLVAVVPFFPDAWGGRKFDFPHRGSLLQIRFPTQSQNPPPLLLLLIKGGRHVYLSVSSSFHSGICCERASSSSSSSSSDPISANLSPLVISAIAPPPRKRQQKRKEGRKEERRSDTHASKQARSFFAPFFRRTRKCQNIGIPLRASLTPDSRRCLGVKKPRSAFVERAVLSLFSLASPSSNLLPALLGFLRWHF